MALMCPECALVRPTEFAVRIGYMYISFCVLKIDFSLETINTSKCMHVD